LQAFKEPYRVYPPFIYWFKKREIMKKFYFLFVLLFVISSKIIAQPAGWLYLQAITITNNATTAGVNIQVPVYVNTSVLVGASQMQASGNDIRFGSTCSGATLYNYYIDSAMNSTATKIWVLIPNLPVGNTVIYMYYGNPAAPAASTLTIFNGPYSSTNQITGGTINPSPGLCTRGFRFSPNVDILVSQFGKNEPSGTPRYVTLWNFSLATAVQQNLITGTASTYTYTNIGNPIWLTANTQYILSLSNSATDGYYYQTSSQINPNLTYYDMRYCNACTQTTFPTTVLANYHYGYPDMMFYTKNTLTPAPTVTIGGGGSGGPGIVLQPHDTSGCPNATVSFTIGVTGSGVTYQWQYNPGSGFVNVPATAPYSGTTTATLVIAGITPPMNLNQFRCVVTNICGSNTTNAALLTVNPNVAPTISITVSPGSTICAGTNVTFTAAITNGGTAPAYQWKVGPAIITGATNNTYSSATLANGNAITCTVTSSNPCAIPASVTSNTITMTVNPKPNITAANNGPICAGATLNLTATSFAGATYSWTGPSYTSNAQNPSITNAQATATGTYTVVATSAAGCSSNPATTNVTVHPLPAATIVANGPTNICVGDNVTLNANTGAGLTYKWRLNTVQITGANNSSYTTGNPGSYTCTVTTQFGCSTLSNIIVVNAKPTPVPTISHTTPLSFCEGNSVLLTGSQDPNNPTFQWYKNTTAINGATSTTYNVFQPGTYTYRITNDFGCTGLSAGTTVVVYPVLNPIISRSSSTLSTTSYVSYQWYYNNAAIQGATGPNISFALNGYYQVECTDANGCTSKSALAWIQDLDVNDLGINTDDIKLYPNPASDMVHIEAPVKVNVSIRNMQGQVVITKDNTTAVTISSLADGVYSVIITNKDGILLKTERLIKMTR
jgi:hypothetical protein